MDLHCVALLGKRDEPTDAIEDYCHYLREALTPHGIALELHRVRWPQLGWPKALKELRETASRAPNAVFIVQYTALNWSRRGFPLRVLRVLRALKQAGGRCVVMFHDSEAYSGLRIIDRIRRAQQLYTMRTAVGMAALAIFNIPVEKVAWLADLRNKAIFIPVGANLPLPESHRTPLASPTQPPSVAVFAVTGDASTNREVQTIASAVSIAAQQIGPLRLILVGRNSEAASCLLKSKLAGTEVEIITHGLVPPRELGGVLSAASVMLFVRGPISSRRGSAIAGIACGLPIVARAGSETAGPITEAGVVLLSSDEDFGAALVRVLSDTAYAASLAERSRQAYIRHFSWSVIAAQYVDALRKLDKSR